MLIVIHFNPSRSYLQRSFVRGGEKMCVEPKQKCKYNCLQKWWKLSLLPKFWGPRFRGLCLKPKGLSLFSLMANPRPHIILLNKLRFDQIGCSGRSGTGSQYGVPKRYEIVKRLETPALEPLNNAMPANIPFICCRSTIVLVVMIEMASKVSKKAP